MSINHFTDPNDGIPPGFITIWTGKLSNIPTGWALCDGNNGTPNLLDKSAKCVPNTTTDPGSTGGQNSVSLSPSQLPSHSHSSGGTGTNGKHTHSMPAKDNKGSYDYAFARYRAKGTWVTSYTSGGHSHSLSTGAAGSSSSVENQPPYYEVAYIQKL